MIYDYDDDDFIHVIYCFQSAIETLMSMNLLTHVAQ